ncbi:hypothetical protein [Halocynthiibacter namhaensis]|uniref:hypothetical protein n=1 Tax=Halocynthiibacter namhaensis TaxID=1290553 RepID=UPI0005798008|nr:hypothetical protein [Halocynthiibacter namhaensis]
MRYLLKKFAHDDDGAITVDWVVLTAGIILLTVTVFVPLKAGLMDGSETIATSIESVTILDE